MVISDERALVMNCYGRARNLVPENGTGWFEEVGTGLPPQSPVVYLRGGGGIVTFSFGALMNGRRPASC